MNGSFANRRLCAAVLTCGACIAGALSSQTRQSVAEVLQEAERLRSEHQESAAATLLENFLAAQGDDLKVLLALARIRDWQRDMAAENALLVRALRIGPNSSDANLMLGTLLLQQHRDPEAMDRFETVLAIDRANATARQGENSAVTELATDMRREGHPELAVVALEHAREKLPDDPHLLLELGIQATELHAFPEALESLTTAHSLQPQDPVTLYALAHAQFDAQHMIDAEASFRTYLRLRPQDASAHFGLGRVLEVTQRFDEARSEFDESIKLQPLQTESYYELADMDVRAGDDAAAEPLLQNTLSRDPHHGGALTDMGMICLHRKQYEQAEHWLAQAVSAAPEYAQAHYQYGLALQKLGRDDESKHELETATELNHAQQRPLIPGDPAVNKMAAR